MIATIHQARAVVEARWHCDLQEQLLQRRMLQFQPRRFTNRYLWRNRVHRKLWTCAVFGRRP